VYVDVFFLLRRVMVLSDRLHAPAALSPEKEFRYPLSRKLCGLQIPSGDFFLSPSVLLDKCRVSAANEEATESLHVLFISLFINDPALRHCIV
jgi:hypothetical protein